MASTDPDFEAKTADLIGLYVNPPFTPTYSSWLNQVELWFAKIECDVIARGIADGFAFRFPAWPEAARDICRRREGSLG